MSNLYTNQTIVLSNLIDSRTAKPIVLDISNYTLPQRKQLNNVRNAANMAGLQFKQRFN